MAPKKRVTRVLQSEVILLEPRIEAPLQTDGTLDQNTSDDSDDDTVSHHIPYTTNPNFTKAFGGATSNKIQNAGGNMGGFVGPSV
jgi:hypothetical protein